MEASVGAFMGQVRKTAHQEKLLKSTLKYQEFKYRLFIIMGFALIFIVHILKENSFYNWDFFNYFKFSEQAFAF